MGAMGAREHARALARAAALLALTGRDLARYLAARALLPQNASLRARARIERSWARGVLRILRVRLHALGEAPRAPFLLVSNHLSYLDIAVLMALAPCAFLARSDVARWPLIGFIVRSTGHLFVERGRRTDLPRAIDAVRATLARGRGVALFPEGTSSAGETVLPFRSSLFEVAARSSAPLWCASLSYRTPPGAPPAHLSVCWWGDMTFYAHLYALLALPGLEASIRFGAQPICGSDRKELARRARDAVIADFTPVMTPAA
jgi:1-acyl-sn-glycerol-3-phosphate acyltransferase